MPKRILIFTGKGGVGKSVISAATGVVLADLGYNVALISSDPAHTIAHYFDISTVQECVKVMDRLELYYVDPVSEVTRKFRAMSEHAIEWLKKYGIDEVLAYELAMLPMVTETVGLLKILDLWETEKYDVIIIDTIPSAEALRLLYLPLILMSVHKRLLKFGVTAVKTAARILATVVGTACKAVKTVEEEQTFFEDAARLAQLLTDPQITSVRVIANPDTSSVDDAVRSVSLAQVFNLNVDLGIMNKIVEKLEQGPSEWIEKHRQYYEKFVTSIYPIPVRKVPVLGVEVRGIEMLRKVGKLLYGDDDPLKIYYVGKILNIKETEDKYILTMDLPAGIQDCTDVVFQGDELVIQLKSDRSVIEKILPLPTMLKLAKPEVAYIEGRKLVIEFRKAI